MAGGDDFVDEGWPVVRPFLLQDGHEDQVELVEERLLRAEGLFGARALNDELDDEVTDSCQVLAQRDGDGSAAPSDEP